MTTDRSLEIVAVGLGQAGGNLAAEFQRRGYRGLAFNTARTDLSSLGAAPSALPEAQRIYIGLEGHDGAGSDVEYGRECIQRHADRIREAVQEHTAGADVVVVAAGLGGGTGSCVSDLIALLDDLDLPIVALTTLPHHHESGVAKVNALRAVRDVAATPIYGWTLVDNARLARLHREAPIDSYFETINAAVVEPLDVLNRLNDREDARAIRTLDGEDYRTLLLSGGVLAYHAQDLAELSAGGVLDAVRGAVAENPMMPAGFDISNVSYLGLVIESSEQLLHETPFSLYEEVAEQLKKETGGAAVYLGIYRKLGADGAPATVRLLCSSKGLPSSIGNMLADAEREAQRIQHKVQQSVEALDLGGLDELNLTRRPGRAGARGESRLAPAPRRARHAMPDPAQRDETPRRQAESAPATGAAAPAPAARTAPAPAPAAEAAPAPRPAATAAPAPAPEAVDAVAEITLKRVVEEPEAPAEPPARPRSDRVRAAAEEPTQVDTLRRLVAVGDPTESAEPDDEAPADAPAAERGAASAEAYRGRFARLANAYKQAAEGDSKRIHIARELVAAQRSGEPLERFYAVHAMSRLDPAFFRDALRNASSDSDSHVADLAKRALKGLR